MPTFILLKVNHPGLEAKKRVDKRLFFRKEDLDNALDTLQALLEDA